MPGMECQEEEINHAPTSNQISGRKKAVSSIIRYYPQWQNKLHRLFVSKSTSWNEGKTQSPQYWCLCRINNIKVHLKTGQGK